MAASDIQRDLGRVEGKMDAALTGISDLKALVTSLQKTEKDARDTLEAALNDRYTTLERRVAASEKRSYILHGIGMSFMFYVSQAIDLKAALSHLIGKGYP